MSSGSESDEIVELASKTRPKPQRKRKTRTKKDPTKPKRGLSPYFCFMKEERPKLMAARPGLKVGEVTKVLAAQWNKLDSKAKEKFVKLADEDKDRYLEEMKEWEAKQNAMSKKASVPPKKVKKQEEVEEEDEDEEDEEEADSE